MLARLIFDARVVQVGLGRAVLNADPDVALRSGLARWARVSDGAGRPVADLDVGLKGSGAEVELNLTEFRKDGPVSLEYIAFLMPPPAPERPTATTIADDLDAYFGS